MIGNNEIRMNMNIDESQISKSRIIGHNGLMALRFLPEDTKFNWFFFFAKDTAAVFRNNQNAMSFELISCNAFP